MLTMLSGERLRSDLRELQRLCVEIRVGLPDKAESGTAAPAIKEADQAQVPLAFHVDLLQAVHERTLAAAMLLLRALEALPRPSLSPSSSLGSSCRCVRRPALLSAAPLVALLWAQVRQLGLGGNGDEGLPGELAGPAGPRLERGLCSRGSQTDDSCLRRCEACCVAEAAVKALVDAFSSEMEEPSVEKRRAEVAEGLSPGLLSQWGAMRSLTLALHHDLQEVLRGRGAALAALEVERSAARLARQDAQRADERALRADAERATFGLAKQAAEKRLSETEFRERARLQELDQLREALQASRGREADLAAELRATRATLDNAGARLQSADAEIQKGRRHADGLADSLQAAQAKLRRQAKHANERYALLLRYPDLHGPMPSPQHEAGDPVLDMESQVRANEVRVSLLNRQNERLRTTIAKLRVLTASGRPPTRNHSRPTSASSPCASPTAPHGISATDPSLSP